MKTKRNIARKYRRRNPAPLFFNEIRSLLGKTSRVQYGSENGFFAITGILEDFKGNGYGIYFENRKNEVLINFDLTMIQQILGNIIILNVPRNTNYDSQTLENTLKKVGNPIEVWINVFSFISKGLQRSFIKGILRYKASEKMFYIQTSDVFLLRFPLESVAHINEVDDEIFVEI